MKKIVSLLLAAVIVLGLCACTAAPQESTPAGDDTPATEVGVVVDTKILKEADDKMLNTYSAIAVNPEAPFVDADGNSVADVYVNTAGADALIQWLLTEEALKAAGEYGFAEYGEYLFYVLDNAPKYAGEIAKATEETKTIRLSTTTSVKDSGLLGYLLPKFESAYGYTVEVQSAGTGKAIADGKHKFISRGDGSGTHTKELALWPADLGITKEAESFASYTEWYTSANTGMGACLVMAEEMGAYILTDKATFLTFVANDGVMG